MAFFTGAVHQISDFSVAGVGLFVVVIVEDAPGRYRPPFAASTTFSGCKSGLFPDVPITRYSESVFGLSIANHNGLARNAH